MTEQLFDRDGIALPRVFRSYPSFPNLAKLRLKILAPHKRNNTVCKLDYIKGGEKIRETFAYENGELVTYLFTCRSTLARDIV